MLKGYDDFGGRHGETASVANVLRYLGVQAPHTGEPYTEEMLFGLGGGLGFSYWVFDYAHMPAPMLSVGFRRFGWEGFDLAFVEDICERVGARVEVRETSSRAKAERELGQMLEEGQAPIITLDWGKLPGSGVPDEMEYVPHVVVVCGVDEGREAFMLDDLLPEPVLVENAALMGARAAVRSVKNRVRLLRAEEPRPPLEESVYTAMGDCAVGLLEQDYRPNSALPALDKWARMTGSRMESKAWRKVFDSPEKLCKALEWTHRWIETGTGGGAFRPMYADFLDEASEILDDAAVREVAGSYRRLGAEWSAFAVEALRLSEAPEEAHSALDALSDELERLHSEEMGAARALKEAAAGRVAAV